MGKMDMTELIDEMDWKNERILLNEWIEGQNIWTKWNELIDCLVMLGVLLGKAWSIAW